MYVATNVNGFYKIAHADKFQVSVHPNRFILCKFAAMLYYVLKFFMFFCLRYYFRRIYVSGLHNLNHGKPVVLASSHPNSFNDAFTLGAMLNRSLNYLARSDVFKTAFLKMIFKSFHMLPVYRIQEGKENISKNRDTFHRCYDILLKNGLVLIFAEGICIQEKRLRKLKKGAARIALGAVEKGAKGVSIVPVGLNYTYPEKFRGELMISIGKPIDIEPFHERHSSHPAMAYQQINKELETALKKEMVIIESPACEEFAEQLLRMARNEMHIPFFSWRFTEKTRLELEQKITEKANHLFAEDKADFSNMSALVNAYFKKLKKYRITDQQIAGKKTGFWLKLWACLMLPIALPAYVFRFPPLFAARHLTEKSVKHIEFYGSVYLSIGFLLYLFLLLLTFLYVIFFFGYAAACLVFLIPLCGFINVFFDEIVKTCFTEWKFYGILRSNPLAIEDLKHMRSEITKRMGF